MLLRPRHAERGDLPMVPAHAARLHGVEGDGASVTVRREKKKKEMTYRRAGKVGARVGANAQTGVRACV